MWAIMCVCHHVCHTQAWSCVSTGWALNRCFAWFFGTVAVLAQGGGGVESKDSENKLKQTLRHIKNGRLLSIFFLDLLFFALLDACFYCGGWFSRWSQETQFIIGRCACAVPALCKHAPSKPISASVPSKCWFLLGILINFGFFCNRQIP